jgi:predicted ArsR family transcriptional regulator
VLLLVADGLTNAAIAEWLWITPGTVRRHLENVYEKLYVHTRTAAVARCAQEVSSRVVVGGAAWRRASGEGVICYDLT